MVQYNESIYFDRAFYSQDIHGSIAYARANIATGILTEAEFTKIEAGLLEVKSEWEQGTFKIRPGVDEAYSEDVKTSCSGNVPVGVGFGCPHIHEDELGILKARFQLVDGPQQMGIGIVHGL